MLGVAPTASADEIKRAFRREIARYHPDKVQHLGHEFQGIAADKAAGLTQAYTTLSDASARVDYDAQLKTGWSRRQTRGAPSRHRRRRRPPGVRSRSSDLPAKAHHVPSPNRHRRANPCSRRIAPARAISCGKQPRCASVRRRTRNSASARRRRSGASMSAARRPRGGVQPHHSAADPWLVRRAG